VKPGKKLDALVAEKVFDYERMLECHWSEAMGYKNDDSHNQRIITATATTTSIKLLNHRHANFAPLYSTSIAAAWEIINHFNDGVNHEGSCYEIGKCEPFGKLHYCQLTLYDGKYLVYTAKGQSAPHAICLAALKAVGYEE